MPTLKKCNIIRPDYKGLRFFIFNYLAKSMKYFTLKFNTAMICCDVIINCEY